ncbi:peptidoglycan-binding protein [Streptomyces sp. NPDC059828]|uniref:peptidoglycan-binding protein n=1 Tax=Streptomyces sp. NPDC059828 TaxID=3346965 RepID=UPI00366A127A
MTVPAFEEYEPVADCGCAGCAQQRRVPARAHPPRARAGGARTAHGARCALLLATAAGVVLYGGGGAGALTVTAWPSAKRPAQLRDPEPETPQGGQGPLHGGPAPGSVGAQAPVLRLTTRADIINRAKRWVDAKVPYSMTDFWSDGYRQDCSGYVSMAWNLPGNEWTGSLAQFGVRLDREALQPGDILLFHNTADPNKGSHVTIFGGWTDYTHTHYIAYEQARPHTRKQATPMAYWSDSASYVAYRYKGVIGASAASRPRKPSLGAVAPYPGAALFGPGAGGEHIAELGRLLRERGAEALLGQAPGARWSEAYRQATLAFQRAQGWAGGQADGVPGPGTWSLLASGRGKDIPQRGAGEATRAGAGAETSGDAAAGTSAPQTAGSPQGTGGGGTSQSGVSEGSAATAPVPAGAGRAAPPDGAASRAAPQGSDGRPPQGVAEGGAAQATPPDGAASRAAPQGGAGRGSLPGGGGQAAAPGGAAGSDPGIGRPQGGAGRAVPDGGEAHPAAPQTRPGQAAPPQRAVQAARAPVYPGSSSFRPGRANSHVEELRRRLAQRGFGELDTSAGPGRQWTEADRRNVRAFQRAQGWRDGAADGYPGPETWLRLFS